MRLGSSAVARERIVFAVLVSTIGVALWIVGSVWKGTRIDWRFVSVTWAFLLALLLALSLENVDE